MKTIQQFWQERSKKYGRRIEGVLPKSFPRFVNNYLDRWMYAQVKSEIRNPKSEILDLGCGYGRLAKKILHDFPESRVIGVDISQYYVNLFNQELSPRGKAIKGDIRKLPFKDSSFDTVIMVTTLMYLRESRDQEKAAEELFRTLRTGGRFVIIERAPRGHAILMLDGLVEKVRGPKKREIPAVSFNPEYMQNLIEKSGGTVETKKGIPPLLTVSLYISYSGVKEK